MTRYGIDALTALRLCREGIVVTQHQLVAPAALRSQVTAIVYREVRAGTTSEADARSILERLTTMKVRVLGDKVSRGTAWRIAKDQGWDEIGDAEYISVTRLQADALVALDPALAAAAKGLVPLATFDALTA